MERDYCAGGLVFCRGRLAVIKRKNGVWLFPKGHIDPGETPEVAARREVLEETGLDARILMPLGDSSYNFVLDGVEHFKTIRWYVMETDTVDFQLEKGIFTDCKWIDPSELGCLTFPNDRELGAEAFRRIQNRKENQKG